MEAFIQQLLLRYTALVEGQAMDPQRVRLMQQRLNALRLADAALAKNRLGREHPDHSIHIGILGPTQAGKSTLVNLLTGSTIAGVSPLAGYTVHAQAFILGGIDRERMLAGAQLLFPGFTAVEPPALTATQLNSFSTSVCNFDSNTPGADHLTPSVLWDSPDFDSVDSRGYRSAVLRVAALADVLILMISKDKYADKSVWDMLQLLLPLGKPWVVCINKLSPGDSAVIVSSFQRRFREIHTGADMPVVIPLPYIKGLDNSASALAEAARLPLLDALGDARLRVDRSAQSINTYHFIDHHWDSWVEPVVSEHAAADLWQALIDSAIESSLQDYATHYLEHPQKYDTFNRALAELLSLLEIPGLAGALGAARQVVTWPVRKLLSLGRAVVDRSGLPEHAVTDLEQEVLAQAVQHLLTHLVNEALEESEKAQDDSLWWSRLQRRLRQDRLTLEQDFARAVAQYQEDFHPRIEHAAQQLYRNLQKQPALLNTLRAARVSADAAAVVLAVKSGGLAATDLVLAPAMLSLTRAG